MTAEEKNALANLLDAADDTLRDGRRRPRRVFADDEVPGREEDPASLLEALNGEIGSCRACGLCEKRTKTVPGMGVPRPLLLVVGEGPGADEDASGLPFVGKAGQLLDRMLASIGLSREKNCYIANVVKCRPPNNRDPLPEEIAACRHFLNRQIGILRPSAILCAGRFAAQTLLATAVGIGKLRGRFGFYDGGGEGDFSGFSGQEGIPLLPTWHPSALLRDDSLKRSAWEDLKLLRSRLVEMNGDYGGTA